MDSITEFNITLKEARDMPERIAQSESYNVSVKEEYFVKLKYGLYRV